MVLASAWRSKLTISERTMSTIPYEQREAKIKEKDSNSSLLLIYEWVKTGQISFDTFEKLLDVRNQVIADAWRFDGPN